MFSKEIYQIAEGLKKQARLLDIENILAEHSKYFIYKTTLSKELKDNRDPKKLFGNNAIRLIQSLLYRSKSLIEGSIITLNNNNILSSIILVRAHFETTGSIGYLLKRLSSYYNGDIDFESIDTDLIRLSLGSKTIEIPIVPEPIGVMNLIDAVDNLLKKKYFKNKERPFRKFYEDLCDFCHPNFQGIIMRASTIIGEERSIIYQETDRINNGDFTFFFYLNISARLFIFFYLEVIKSLKNNEFMPIFQKDK